MVLSSRISCIMLSLILGFGCLLDVTGQSIYAPGLPYGASSYGNGYPSTAYQPAPFHSNLLAGSLLGYPTGSGLTGGSYGVYPYHGNGLTYPSANSVYPSYNPMGTAYPYSEGTRDPCLTVSCGPGRYCEPLSYTSFNQPGGSYRCRRINFNSPLVEPSGTKVGRCFDELVYKVPVGAANDRVRGGFASAISCPDKCQRSQECGPGKICCNNGCGNICHTPETTVIDTVNPSSPTSNGLSYTNNGYGLAGISGPIGGPIGPPASFFPNNRRMADLPSVNETTASSNGSTTRKTK